MGTPPRLVHEVAVRAGDRAAALAVAHDVEAPMSERVAALGALAVIAARERTAPAALADLLDDGPLVDAAFAAGAAGAITGLALALGDALPAAQRRYLATIAAGAGASGLHVAALALAAGDPAFAARAAAAELAAVPADAPVHARILAGLAGAGTSFWAALDAATEARAEMHPEVSRIIRSHRGRAPGTGT